MTPPTTLDQAWQERIGTALRITVLRCYAEVQAIAQIQTEEDKVFVSCWRDPSTDRIQVVELLSGDVLAEYSTEELRAQVRQQGAEHWPITEAEALKVAAFSTFAPTSDRYALYDDGWSSDAYGRASEVMSASPVGHCDAQTLDWVSEMLEQWLDLPGADLAARYDINPSWLDLARRFLAWEADRVPSFMQRD